jgi:thiol-disulfide isomerase/thioredoxin
MKKKYFLLGYAVGVAGFLILLFWGVKNIQSLIAPPDIIDKIELSDLDGNVVDVKDFSGKPLIINYWATWCSPCLKEFPYFENVKQQYGDEINFVMISDEKPEKQLSFIQKNNYSVNFLKSRKPLEKIGIRILPATYFYDADGKLLDKQAGGLDQSDLIRMIQKLNKNQ